MEFFQSGAARARRSDSNAVWRAIHAVLTFLSASGARRTLGGSAGAPAGSRRFVALRGVMLALVLATVLPFSVTDAVSDTTPPSTPTGLTASAVTQSSLTLTWSAANDNVAVTGYRVYRDGTLVASPTSTSALITGLSPSTTYSFTVSAVDAAGNASAQSAPVSVTTPAPLAPTVSISAFPATIAPGQISTLTWSSTNANSCTASDGWSGTKANSGSQAVTPSATTTYILSCTGAGGFTSESATVTVTATGAITPSLVASRVSGAAPLAGFFDATGTTDASVTSRPFHEIEYCWDFGDPAGGATWSAGRRAGVSSKNSATGPVAAHVFEQAGTHNVSLTVTDGTNTVSNSCVQIEVSDPDGVFAADTICFSTSGNFTGCPAGGTQVTNSNFTIAIATHQGTNRRLLFRRGETWNAASTAVLTAPGPGIVGTFGTGAKPRIRSSVTDVTIISFGGTNFTDWRVMDLEIDCQAQNLVVGIQPSGNARHMLFLRMAIHDCEHGYISYYPEDGAINANFPWQQIAIVDTTITNSRQYGIFLSTRNFALLGSTVDTTATEHVMRHPYIQKSVISNNTLANASPGKHIIKLVSQNFPATGAFNEQIVISDNKFGGAGVDWTVAFGPQNSTEDERVRDVVVERNWFTASSGTQVALIVFASEVTVRNNICDMTGGFDAICFNVSRRGIEPAPNNVRIYNNTAFLSTAVSDFTVVSLGSTASNITVRNNLGSAPLATTRTMVSGNPPGLVQSNNLMNNSPAALFVNAAPTVPADFQLKALPNPARNTGFATVPVFSDFFRSSRPQNGVIDIGAAEGP